MTPQEFFDLTVLHLWRQGGPARSESESCKYLTQSNLRCAAGYWLDPALYRPKMEGVVIGHTPKHGQLDPLDALRPEAREHASLLKRLQACHDQALHRDGKWIREENPNPHHRNSILHNLEEAAMSHSLKADLAKTLFANLPT